MYGAPEHRREETALRVRHIARLFRFIFYDIIFAYNHTITVIDVDHEDIIK